MSGVADCAVKKEVVLALLPKRDEGAEGRVPPEALDRAGAGRDEEAARARPPTAMRDNGMEPETESFYQRLKSVDQPLADMVYVLYGDRPWRSLGPLQKALAAALLLGPLILFFAARWTLFRKVPLRLILFFWVVGSLASVAHWSAGRLGLHRTLVSTTAMLLSVFFFGFPYFEAMETGASLLPAFLGLTAALAASLGVGGLSKLAILAVGSFTR